VHYAAFMAPTGCWNNLMPATTLKLSYVWPLAGFVAPTLIIGFGFVIPGSCIAGLNDLTIGFAATIAGACATYWIGLITVLRDRSGSREEA
jgi:hypothetical protein